VDSERVSRPPLVALIVEDGVAVVRLQDEAGKNALSHQTVPELERIFAGLSGREDVKAVVLAGLPEYFCTGASRTMLNELVEGGVAPRDLLLPRALLGLDVPLIAAMQGHALGGGFVLGLCADIILAARESRYGCNFINYGFTPGMGATGLVEHVLGPSLAREMLLTGNTFRGTRLQGNPGLNYVLPRAEVLPKALDLAACLAEKSRRALSVLKISLSSARRQVFEAARTSEILMHELTFHRAAVAEAIQDQYPA
jgi:polyketide biosynthesis enoyl-CoA hydratase PksI